MTLAFRSTKVEGHCIDQSEAKNQMFTVGKRALSSYSRKLVHDRVSIKQLDYELEISIA